jgi:urease accessory protein
VRAATEEEVLERIGQTMSVLQFGDSLLPIGSFSFSNGLESAVQQGIVHDPATLAQFTMTAVHRAAISDCIALLHAHRAACEADLDGVIAADEAVFCRKLSEETRAMTVRMGRSLSDLAVRVVRAPVLSRWRDEIAARNASGTYPVALGVLFAALGGPERDAFSLHQYGVAMTMLSSALRLMRIEPAEVQVILYDVNTRAGEDYVAVRGLSLSDMAGFAPATEILAAMHVRAHVRMFMN